jgi:tetratricopeptide (TPR) repeat protein
MHPCRRVLALLPLVLGAVSVGFADDPWIGQKVMDKRGARLVVENFEVPNYRISWPATVRKESGDSLCLGRAWVTKLQVVKLDDALDYYTDEIRSHPDSWAYTSRGIAWQEKNEYDKAISDFSEAIRLDPQHAAAYNGRGIAWAGKKEYDKAINDYSEAIHLNPQDAVPYNNRGLAWVNKKEYDKAINDYSEAIRLDPQYAVAYNSRGWLLATCVDAKCRDGKRSVTDALEACELDQYKEAGFLDTLAVAYAESGDFASAVKWQEKAVELGGTGPDVKSLQEHLALFKREKPVRDNGE